jgi:hypothetical protein
LFVIFPQSPERILKGLQGAGLPAIIYADASSNEIPALPLMPVDEAELSAEAADAFDPADLEDIGQRDRPPE